VIRVIAGDARGRKLKGPKGLQFRPTTGRVKEFIFSYLYDLVQNAKILDLFSGTGSLGIEALSRGAEQVTFIEQSKAHLRILKENIHLCHYESCSRVLQGDVFSHVLHFGQSGEQFNLILADPPFKQNLRQRILQAVEKACILLPEGLLIIEHEQHDENGGCGSLEQIKARKFGHCIVSIYR